MKLFNRKERRAGNKEPRPSKQIQQDYQVACQGAGDRAFQISILEAQIKQLHENMHNLGNEMNQALARETAEARGKQGEQTNAPKQD